MSTGYTPDIEAVPHLSDESFHRFAELIRDRLGIKMDLSKSVMLEGRLTRRARALGLQTLGEYEAYLLDSVDGFLEYPHFVDAVTTHKTEFFREAEHFIHLTDVASKWQRPGEPGSRETFRVWSAGCSTGEEAWTIAMTLGEFQVDHPGFQYSVLGTDVSQGVLGRARIGVYSDQRLGMIPAELWHRYLLRSRDPARKVFRISPELRSKVRFHEVNFADLDYGLTGSFAAIFFRNVMIYFDRQMQEAVVRRISRYLSPNRVLFLGHSESLAGLDVPLQQVGPAMFRLATPGGGRNA